MWNSTLKKQYEMFALQYHCKRTICQKDPVVAQTLSHPISVQFDVKQRNYFMLTDQRSKLEELLLAYQFYHSPIMSEICQRSAIHATWKEISSFTTFVHVMFLKKSMFVELSHNTRNDSYKQNKFSLQNLNAFESFWIDAE